MLNARFKSMIEGIDYKCNFAVAEGQFFAGEAFPKSSQLPSKKIGRISKYTSQGSFVSVCGTMCLMFHVCLVGGSDYVCSICARTFTAPVV
jgi:hypothetical protein